MSNFSIYRVTKLQDKIFGSKNPFPCSNYRCLIFPFDLNLNQYNIDSFKSVFAGNRVSDYEVMLFFERLHKDVEVLRRISPEILNRELRILILSPLLIFTLGGALRLFSELDTGYSYEVIGDIGKWVLQFFSLVWFCLGVFIIFMKSRRLELEIKIRVADFIANENKTFEKKGVKWRLPAEHFYWIEMDLFFKETEDPELFYKIIKNKNFTDRNVLQFEYNTVTKRYDKEYYQSRLTDDYIGKLEVDEFFDSVHEIMREDFQKENYAKYLKILAISTGIIFACGLILGIFHDFFLAHFVLLSDFWIFFFVGFKIMERRKYKTDELRKKLQIHVKAKNSACESRGIRWLLPPPGINCIELWLDYKFVLEAVDNNSLPEMDKEPTELPPYEPEILPGYRWGDLIDLSKIRPPPGKENYIVPVTISKESNDSYQVQEDLLE